MKMVVTMLWMCCLLACEGKASRREPPALPAAQPRQQAKSIELTPAATPVLPAATAEYAVAWSNDLALGSLGDIDERLRREERVPFCDLSKDDTVVEAASCQQWFKLRAEGYEPSSTIEETGDGAARIKCGTLQQLKSAAPATKSFVRGLKLDASLLAVLPAALATALSREEVESVKNAERAQESLQTYDPKARAKKLSAQLGLEIHEGDGASTITVRPQAWGDFDGDGTDDLLVSVDNTMTEGSLSTVRLIALTRNAPGAVLRVLSSN